MHGPLPTDGRPAAAGDDRPADVRRGLRHPGVVLPRPDGRRLRRARSRAQRAQGRAASTHTPQDNAADVHAIIEALGGGPVELFGSSGGAVTALELVTPHPDDVSVARRARAADPRRAARRRPTPRAERWRSSRRATTRPVGGRDGRVHRADLVAGRVHRRLPRPARSRPGAVRDADRGRRLARRPAAVRRLERGHGVRPGPRRAARPRRRGWWSPSARSRAEQLPGAPAIGPRRPAGPGGDGLPQPPRRLPGRRARLRRQAGGVRRAGCARCSRAERACQCTTTGGTPSSSSRCVSSCLRGRNIAGITVSSTIPHATQ